MWVPLFMGLWWVVRDVSCPSSRLVATASKLYDAVCAVQHQWWARPQIQDAVVDRLQYAWSNHFSREEWGKLLDMEPPACATPFFSLVLSPDVPRATRWWWYLVRQLEVDDLTYAALVDRNLLDTPFGDAAILRIMRDACEARVRATDTGTDHQPMSQSPPDQREPVARGPRKAMISVVERTIGLPFLLAMALLCEDLPEQDVFHAAEQLAGPAARGTHHNTLATAMEHDHWPLLEWAMGCTDQANPWTGTDEQGNHLVLLACEHGAHSILHKLLLHEDVITGRLATLSNYKGDSPLFVSLTQHDLEAMRMLERAEHSVWGFVDEKGQSVLMRAIAKYEHVDLEYVFGAAGCRFGTVIDLSHRSDDGFDLVLTAAAHNRVNVLIDLMGPFGDSSRPSYPLGLSALYSVDRRGRSVLHVAMANGAWDVAAMLLTSDAIPDAMLRFLWNSKDVRTGMNVLASAASTGFTEPSSASNFTDALERAKFYWESDNTGPLIPDGVKSLVRQQLTCADGSAVLPLVEAAKQGNEAFVEFMTVCMARVWGPAFMHECAECVGMVCDDESSGQTAYEWAVFNQHSDMVFAMEYAWPAECGVSRRPVALQLDQRDASTIDSSTTDTGGTPADGTPLRLLFVMAPDTASRKDVARRFAEQHNFSTLDALDIYCYLAAGIARGVYVGEHRRMEDILTAHFRDRPLPDEPVAQWGGEMTPRKLVDRTRDDIIGCLPHSTFSRMMVSSLKRHLGEHAAVPGVVITNATTDIARLFRRVFSTAKCALVDISRTDRSFDRKLRTILHLGMRCVYTPASATEEKICQHLYRALGMQTPVASPL